MFPNNLGPDEVSPGRIDRYFPVVAGWMANIAATLKEGDLHFDREAARIHVAAPASAKLLERFEDLRYATDEANVYNVID